MTIPTPTVNPGLAGGDAHALPHAPLPAGLPPLYEAALRVVARDALLLRDGVL